MLEQVGREHQDVAATCGVIVSVVVVFADHSLPPGQQLSPRVVQRVAVPDSPDGVSKDAPHHIVHGLGLRRQLHGEWFGVKVQHHNLVGVGVEPPFDGLKHHPERHVRVLARQVLGIPPQRNVLFGRLDVDFSNQLRRQRERRVAHKDLVDPRQRWIEDLKVSRRDVNLNVAEAHSELVHHGERLAHPLAQVIPRIQRVPQQPLKVVLLDPEAIRLRDGRVVRANQCRFVQGLVQLECSLEGQRRIGPRIELHRALGTDFFAHDAVASLHSCAHRVVRGRRCGHCKSHGS
mmetsp:Transcript_5083/g.15486  ORF Transcript_5083/g.15486 Transcript_5083/m.15486 type:complete len:290 (-) Transcript_5083:16-885(-)